MFAIPAEPFQNRGGFTHAGNTDAYIAFDDMCYSRRLIESKQHLHKTLQVLLQLVSVLSEEPVVPSSVRVHAESFCMQGCRHSDELVAEEGQP